MQTSMVFNQARWPGAGDVDDCAPVSAVQAVNVTSPWLRLVGVKQFRAAAGNPDDPNAPDGLTERQVVAGIVGIYPILRGHLVELRGDSWANLVRLAESGHPLTVAVDSSKLPEPLQFGFRGRHRITLAFKSDQLLYANPLAKPYSRWLRIEWDDVRRAIMAFGVLMNGIRGAWAVALPTDVEAYELLRAWTDPTPFGQDDIDAATAELQARIDAARAALGDG